MSSELLSYEDLEAALRAIGAERYHKNHVFHKLLHGGKLNLGQIQAWALNRYYYQANIPVKDGIVLSRLATSADRRAWRSRLVDHDGEDDQGGGVDRWLKLAENVGLDRDYVISTNGILPTTRFAVEAYVTFVRERSVLEAVASSLTEMFSPNIISERMSGMLANYSFITQDTLAYFTPRLTQAKRDVEFALAYVKQHADTREKQELVLDALRFKCACLWSQLDALYLAYVDPKLVAPGAFVPEDFNERDQETARHG